VLAQLRKEFVEDFCLRNGALEKFISGKHHLVQQHVSRTRQKGESIFIAFGKLRGGVGRERRLRQSVQTRLSWRRPFAVVPH
jgi:hypothetical protein